MIKEPVNPGNKNTLIKISEILLPILLFWMICNVTMLLGSFLFQAFCTWRGITAGQIKTETISRVSVYTNAAAFVITIPFMYGIFNKERSGFKIPPRYAELKKISMYFMSVILGGSASVALNIAFSKINFQSITNRYQEVAEMQYSVPLLSGILIYGFISPIAEEILFRGILILKFNKYFTPPKSILLSALIFGIYHGNIVQAVYAFLLGLILSVCYNAYKDLKVPILIHGSANLSVFLITSHKGLEDAVSKMSSCFFLSIISIITLYVLLKPLKKLKSEC